MWMSRNCLARPSPVFQRKIEASLLHMPQPGTWPRGNPLISWEKQGAEALNNYDVAPELLDLGGARPPNHAGALARVAEGVDERLDDLALVLPGRGGLLLEQGVPHGPPQRQPLDALGGPVGGDLPAAHPPDLLRVGLEEDVEQPLAELFADPVLE